MFYCICRFLVYGFIIKNLKNFLFKICFKFQITQTPMVMTLLSKPSCYTKNSKHATLQCICSSWLIFQHPNLQLPFNVLEYCNKHALMHTNAHASTHTNTHIILQTYVLYHKPYNLPLHGQVWVCIGFF